MPCGLFRPSPGVSLFLFWEWPGRHRDRETREGHFSVGEHIYLFSFVAVGDFDSYLALDGFSRRQLGVCCHERSEGACKEHFRSRSNAFSLFFFSWRRLLNHPASCGFTGRQVDVFSRAMLWEKDGRWWCKAPTIAVPNGRTAEGGNIEWCCWEDFIFVWYTCLRVYFVAC